MASLAEIRAKLREQENKSTGSSGGGDNGIYPFWNLAEGQEAVIRFLPDGDPDNTFFWAERAMIKLPFQGVKGGDAKPVQVQVPCVEMWNETCPILSEVRGWFKDKSLEDMGRKYWKKRSYVFQGLVAEDPLKEETTPENPIRRFIIGPQIFQIVRSALLDPEMEDLPTDYAHGVDFRIHKGSKGGYADYGASKWSRRERALTQEEQDAVKAHGLFKLKDYLPKKPTDVELKVIKEMFEASVDGDAFDIEKWGQYYRPSGMSAATGDPQARSAPAVKAAPVEDEDAPFEVEPKAETKTAPKAPETKAGGDSKAQDILSMIRARQNKN